MILVIGGAFQGKTEYVKNTFNAGETEVFNAFHLKIRETMENGGDVLKITETAKSFKYVISDEVGSGVIPLDKFDRSWRETVGRELCKLAAEACEVHRVVCGVGRRIK
ncbi:MAG: bifunctional adenosylcobinamide kinase/adenosylcobinamide-phosphate guanylyltransferase [Firmicutes bacterium]|nr:bifunctional adenosylcobinamide kinase/adenosylcobinamide-phosphate guanylyltransferase [Bacillota bacterium]